MAAAGWGAGRGGAGALSPTEADGDGPLQWQEEQQRAQSLQSTIMAQEAENQVLGEQLKQQATQLEKVRGRLQGLQLQLQQQTAEVSHSCPGPCLPPGSHTLD